MGTLHVKVKFILRAGGGKVSPSHYTRLQQRWTAPSAATTHHREASQVRPPALRNQTVLSDLLPVDQHQPACNPLPSLKCIF